LIYYVDSVYFMFITRLTDVKLRHTLNIHPRFNKFYKIKKIYLLDLTKRLIFKMDADGNTIIIVIDLVRTYKGLGNAVS
jgi:predicted GH43/DUF377 family glycosyl hydrolase